MDKALGIAKSALRQCYTPHGILAGKNHFNDYWARDSFFASWGALELNDFDVVRKNLEFFLRKMSDEGQIPLRIGLSTIGQCLSLIGVKTKKSQKPQYFQDKGRNPPLDSNSLFIITMYKYVEKTHDFSFARKNLEKIRMVIEWLEKREIQGVLSGGKYSTWQDMIKKEGFVLYTNVLYYEALVSLSRLLGLIGVENEFLEKAEVVKESINKNFWDKKLGYYIDYYNPKTRSKVFSTDGNFYSILSEVADHKQADSILYKAEKFGISKNVPSYTNYPRHSRKESYLPFYIFGMQDYNDYGVSWTWIGCVHAMALFNAGKKDDAKKIIGKLTDVIIRDKDVYEVYERNGMPLKRLFYKSEHPFAWSAGFYIIADKLINKK